MSEHMFIELFGGLRVRWKPTKATGTVLSICVDVENPERCGIEAEVRWDDGKVFRYNAMDFALSGNMEGLLDSES